MSFLFRKRRSMGAEQGRQQGYPTSSGIQSMDESLQKKFSKGIQFNMKIIIRGDRNTGKSCLFNRMEGKPYKEAYIPTNEIQVTSILWSYRVTNDTVKVEIWDIVDKGRSQKKGKSLLKMFNSPSGDDVTDPADMPLDAEFMDVYKGAHGVVFTFDMTKQWTWKYIEKEVPNVPLHIPIMILANFRDMGEHRVVSRDEVVVFIEQLARPEGAAAVRYAESSMKMGFGLMHLHKFLSVPFLQLQQETLLRQLQVNREQTLAAKEELDSAGKSEDQNYDMFLQRIERFSEEKRKRSDSQVQQDSASSAGGDSPKIPSRSNTMDRTQQDTPTSPRDEPQRSGSISSKFTSKFSFLSRNKEAPKNEETSTPTRRDKTTGGTTIDDFVPDGGEVDSFLEDSDESEEEDSETDSDDDIDGGNPQVAMNEDLSSPEEEEAPPMSTKAPRAPQVKKQPKLLKSAKEIVLTESEEESEEPSADEDVNFEEVKVSSYKSKPPEQKAPIFDDTTLNQLFEMSPKKETKEKTSHKSEAETTPTESIQTKSTTKKSSGLLLEFSSPTPPPASKPNKEPIKSSVHDSPDLNSERRDSKRKKKSKKRKEPKTPTETVTNGGRKEETSVQVTSSDPFGAISSLDAWLNSEVTGKDGPLETSWSTHTSANKVELAEEVGSEEEEEEHREKEKKPKKHRHRRHREDGEERTSHKKKHKHKSSSSRRKTLEQDGDKDYEAL